MTLGQNPFNPSPSLPTLAAIKHRCEELLAYQALQQAEQSTTAKGNLLAEDQAYPPEESRPFDGQEEREDSQELQAPYEDEYLEPSAPPPPKPSAPPPPALAVAALYGLAGRIVNSLTPHTEADPAAVLLQFLAAFGNLVAQPLTAGSVPPATVSISSLSSSGNQARPAKEPAGARSPASSPKQTRSGPHTASPPLGPHPAPSSTRYAINCQSPIAGFSCSLRSSRLSSTSSAAKPVSSLLCFAVPGMAATFAPMTAIALSRSLRLISAWWAT